MWLCKLTTSEMGMCRLWCTERDWAHELSERQAQMHLHAASPGNAYVRCQVGAETGSEWVDVGYIGGMYLLLHSSL